MRQHKETKLKKAQSKINQKKTVELLRYANCLDGIDDDVANLCLELIPKDKTNLLSVADLNTGMQKIKDAMCKTKDKEIQSLKQRIKEFETELDKEFELLGLISEDGWEFGFGGEEINFKEYLIRVHKRLRGRLK